MDLNIDRQAIERYSSLELLAKQVVEGFITGLHKSPFHGFSVEFAEHRLYNNGESIRHIDWKLFGRTDKLFVKRYEEETNLRCQIILDVSSSMYYPPLKEVNLEKQNKLSFSVMAAAAIIQILKKQRDAVGLSVFDHKIIEHTEAKSSTAHTKHLYQILSDQFNKKDKEQKSTDAASVLHQLANTLHKRSLIILFSDMFENMLEMDSFFDSLRHLKHNKHEVIIFHVHDKNTEYDFDYDHRPRRFVDLENGEVIKLQPKEIKKAYQEQMGSFENELKLKCAQYSIDLVKADIQQDFNQILFPFLTKRKKLY